ncbi:MAG: 50S ribosomal protein L32 [Candidatus Limnocylindrus sp.]
MGVPKRKASKSRQGDRRAHHALSLPAMDRCAQCGATKRAHHACLDCGTYRGREVIRRPAPDTEPTDA